MTNALDVVKLEKRYPGFALNQVSFAVPEGSIMGFIGENGAGKTTTIKAVLGLIRKDGGCVTVLGEAAEAPSPEIKDQIGVVFDSCCFHASMNARGVGKMLAGIYRRWDGKCYDQYLRRFQLDDRKPIKQYSRGMTTKLSIAAALSHNARLLILDEALDGLDPIVRDEMLEVFQEFVEDERRAILLSLHNTGDLAKICDYVTYLHEGQVALSRPAHELFEQFGVARCGADELGKIDRGLILGGRKNAYGCELLIRDRRAALQKCPGLAIDKPALDEIMLLYGKELN